MKMTKAKFFILLPLLMLIARLLSPCATTPYHKIHQYQMSQHTITTYNHIITITHANNSKLVLTSLEPQLDDIKKFETLMELFDQLGEPNDQPILLQDLGFEGSYWDKDGIMLDFVHALGRFSDEYPQSYQKRIRVHMEDAKWDHRLFYFFNDDQYDYQLDKNQGDSPQTPPPSQPPPSQPPPSQPQPPQPSQPNPKTPNLNTTIILIAVATILLAGLDFWLILHNRRKNNDK